MTGFRRLFAALLLLPFVLFDAGPALAAKRVALVIGNAAYRNVPALANPRNDAADMAAKLKGLGFEVVEGLDQDLDAMRATVRDFIRRLEGAELSLFFYAGHGLQVKGENYMAPVDAQLASESDLDFETLGLRIVVDAMETETATSIVLLDACRDNPLANRMARSMGTRSAAVGPGLAQIGAGIGTLIAFATQPGNVALDGEGRNSPFTAALLQHLGTPGQDITRELVQVRRSVMERTGGDQVPWDNSSLTGDVVLASPETVAAPPPPLVVGRTAVDMQIELAFWTAVRESRDPAVLQTYLDKYPQGEFAKVALAIIAGLNAPGEARSAPAPEIDQNAMHGACLRNKSGKTVNYEVQWSGEGWGNVSVQPRGTWCHWRAQAYDQTLSVKINGKLRNLALKPARCESINECSQMDRFSQGVL